MERGLVAKEQRAWSSIGLFDRGLEGSGGYLGNIEGSREGKKAALLDLARICILIYFQCWNELYYHVVNFELDVIIGFQVTLIRGPLTCWISCTATSIYRAPNLWNVCWIDLFVNCLLKVVGTNWIQQNVRNVHIYISVMKQHIP